jgi:hypothetical protein
MVEVETQIRKVLDSTDVLPPGASPDPLERGIASIKVGTSGPVVQGLQESRSDTRGTDFSWMHKGGQ